MYYHLYFYDICNILSKSNENIYFYATIGKRGVMKISREESIGYQIYLKSFKDSNNDGIGDINGVIEKLDYIKSLGVDFIWLSPFYDSPMEDNGYDIRNYYKILKEYGTMQDVDNLIKKAHSLGIKVVADLVLNHTSNEHEWFIKSENNEKGYEDFYYWKKGKVVNGQMVEPNNWQSIFGGPAWQYSEKRKEYYLRIFSKKMPDINYNSNFALNKVKEVISFWAKKGIDGFRVDAISHIAKDETFSDAANSSYGKYSNREKVHTFLSQIASEWQKYDMLSLGELGRDSTLKDFRNFCSKKSKELSAIFEFSIINLFDFESYSYDIKDLFNSLKLKQKIAENGGCPVLFWTNHDYPRVASMFGSKKFWNKSCSALACLMYLLKGMPIIFNGEEIGMTNYHFQNINDFDDVNAKTLLSLAKTDEEKNRVFENLKLTSRDNARTMMQWNDNKNAGFTDATPWFRVNDNYKQVNVEAQDKQQDSVLNEYRKILALRSINKDVFCYGKTKFGRLKGNVIKYTRIASGKKCLVVVNLSDDTVATKLPKGETLYCNYDSPLTNALSPYEARVINISK